MRLRHFLSRIGFTRAESVQFQRLSTETELEEYGEEVEPDLHKTDHRCEDGEGNSSEAWENRRVMGFLYAIAVIEGLDLSLLPASFKALESQSGMTPTKLGALAMSQALFQGTAAMVWGSLADRGISRKHLLATGALGWGILTVFMGMAEDFAFLFVLRCLNGVALASLTPVCQSILSDVAPASRRGVAFGFIQFSISFGQGLSSLCVASVSELQVVVGGREVAGWRLAFICVGLLSMALSIAVALGMPEPRWQGEGQPERAEQGRGCNVLGILAEERRLLWSHFGIASFVVIVVQGAFGMIPWNAMSFMILWLQYLGLSDIAAGAVSMSLTFSCGVGGILGGLVGDRLAGWSRFHGRPLAAQISVLSGIVVFLILLLGVPPSLRTFPVFAGLCISFGLTGSWAAVSCNSPLLLELVSPASRARILALLTAINAALSSMLGGPVVGLLSEAMGYRVPAPGLTVERMLASEREGNLKALTWALLCATIPPWLLCLATYSGLHCTYKRDVMALAASR